MALLLSVNVSSNLLWFEGLYVKPFFVCHMEVHTGMYWYTLTSAVTEMEHLYTL